MLGQQGRDADRFPHSVRSCPSLPGNIEGGSVTGTGAHDRESESDIHRSLKTDQLERNVSLIVIHRHDTVKLAGNRSLKQRIGRQRSDGIDADRLHSGHRRCDHCLFLRPKQSLLARVRIQRAETDSGRSTADFA